MSPKKTTRDFAHLRALARTLLLTHGTALSPGAVTHEAYDDLIAALVADRDPTLAATSEALYARIPDRDLAIDISNHGGSLMAAYGDAGYFVGLSVGLELAALTVGGAVVTQERTK